jgi:hypothetical protein
VEERLAILKMESFVTAVIPFGGNVISDDIKKKVVPSLKKQAFKVKFGSAWPGEKEITKLFLFQD